MRRLALILLLALLVAHAAAITAAPVPEATVASLQERIARGAPDRYRAAFLLAQRAGPDGHALEHFRYAAAGGHLPAIWLLAKRRLLGGRLGGVEVEPNQAEGCALLARLLDPAVLEVQPGIAAGGGMVDYGVSLRVARTTQTVATRLAAAHCPPPDEAGRSLASAGS